MIVAAAGMELEIVLVDLPVVAQPVDHARRVKALGDNLAEHAGQPVALADEARLDEIDRHQRHAVRDAGIGVSYRAALQHRALGAGEGQRGGDVDGLANPRRVVAQQLGDGGRGAHRAPGAMRVHVGPQRGRDADACTDFVAQDQRLHCRLAGQALDLCHRPDGGQGVDRGMALGEAVALVHFQEGAGGAVQERGGGRHGRLAGAHHCSLADRADGQLGRQRLHLGLGRAAHDGADRVEDHVGRLLDGGGLQGFEAEVRDELRERIEPECGHAISPSSFRDSASPRRRASPAIRCRSARRGAGPRRDILCDAPCPSARDGSTG